MSEQVVTQQELAAALKDLATKGDLAEATQLNKRDLAEATQQNKRDLAEATQQNKRDLAEATQQNKRDLAEAVQQNKRDLAEAVQQNKRDLAEATQEITEKLTETIRDTQTEVLRAFYNWARPIEIRMNRTDEIGARLALIEERVAALERGKFPTSH
jgi:predicted nucleic acid-binding OB-fold protein